MKSGLPFIEIQPSDADATNAVVTLLFWCLNRFKGSQDSKK